MHAYIGYHSEAALAGPIVVCVLWDSGHAHYFQVGIDLIDSMDFNSSLMSVLQRISRGYPTHRFTVRSIFGVGRNCRTVLKETEDGHQRAVQKAKAYFRQIMRIYDEQWPQWRFTEHWGGNNRLHKQIINEMKTVLPIHRKTFWPCSKYSLMNQRHLGKGKLRTQRKSSEIRSKLIRSKGQRKLKIEL
jgi:hypothetical protein